jgi:hypothetical protein
MTGFFIYMSELSFSEHSGYYECHITLDKEYAEAVGATAEKHGFKVSALKGDEFMGDDIKIYLTSHAKTQPKMLERMGAVTKELEVAKIPYIRRKIEHIILDERVIVKHGSGNDKAGTQASNG